MTIPSFCTLKSRSVLEITGADAKDFLQGLITNDISIVSQSQAIYAALLTPQGKILFDFFISQPHPDTYWLECSRQHCADLVKRLGFYKLRADVIIKALSDDLKVTCIWGDGAETAVGGYGYADPREAQAGVRMIATAEAISITGNRVDVDAYTAHRVKLGLADSEADIGSSLRFAHECNLDMLNGVDFSKGCYVGQEVVSRMHHKQAARKRILPVSAPHPLTTGLAILAEGKSIGEILTSTGTHALAVLRLDKADAAIAAGKDLTVDDTTIRLNKPDWARFAFPGETNNE
jgi:tRNA-modifying protein YgfZ